MNDRLLRELRSYPAHYTAAYEAADEIERLRAKLRAAEARADALAGALRYCVEAIETGRSEPLFIARDNARNTLEDCAALSAPAAEAGWRLVPVESTSEMRDAAEAAFVACPDNMVLRAKMMRCWRAMLAASPCLSEKGGE